MFAGFSFVHQSLNPGSPSLVTILCRAEEWMETYRRENLGSLNDIQVKWLCSVKASIPMPPVYHVEVIMAESG